MSNGEEAWDGPGPDPRHDADPPAYGCLVVVLLLLAAFEWWWWLA